MNKVGDLSNDELIARLRTHVGAGHVWLAGLLAYLAEVDARHLYADFACSSMWDYCVRRLGMSEGEAHRRIAVARVVRAFPRALELIERGDIHLSGMYALRDYLTIDNHEELLRDAVGKTTKRIAEMIACRFPRPDVHACIEPIAPQVALPSAALVVGCSGASLTQASTTTSPARTTQVRPSIEPTSASRFRVELTVSTDTRAKIERIKDLMRHRNPTGDLEAIFDAALDLLLSKLEKERLGKTSRPTSAKNDGTVTGDCASEAVSAALEVARNVTVARDERTSDERADEHELEPRASGAGAPVERASDARASAERPAAERASEHRASEERASEGRASEERASGQRASVGRASRERAADGATAPPRSRGATRAKTTRAATTKATRPGYVSRGVRREVFARDGEQCTFVDADGNRCPARGHLELDHIRAKALGGGDDPVNLRVRCRTHNRWHAEKVFGRAHVEKMIDLRRRKSEPTGAPTAFERAAGGLRSLGFREAEVRRVISMLESMLDAASTPEKILREALALLT